MGIAMVDEADDPKLAQCLAILAGKTDEHKFAGLLMVTKHLQTEDPAALQRIRKAVLDTAGVSFFVRLLHTQGGGESAENVETDSRVSPFQSLALNLISSFCQDSSLAREFSTAAVVKVVLEVLPVAVSTGNTAVLQDCLHILHGLLAYDVLASHATWKSTFIREIHQCCVSTPVPDESLCLLLSLLQSSPAISEDDLTSLCTSFAAISTPSTGKALLQDYFLATLGSHDPSAVSSNAVSLAQGLFGTWPAHVHDDVARRDSSLQLLSLLLSCCGSDWLFHSEQPWAHVALQLSAIEAKLLLDDAERILIDHIVTPTPSEEDQAKVLERVHSLLPASYGILEAVLGGLMVDANAAALSHTTLLQLKDALGQVFTVVIEFLTTCRDALRSSHLTFPLKDLDPVVLATIRVLGAWMAEETDLLTDQLVELIPFLVTFSPVSSLSVVSSELWDSDDEVDDADATTPRPPSAVTDVVPFLLPGLLQLTATDGGAAAVATDDAVLKKILQFTGSVCGHMVAAASASGDNENTDEGVGTLTMCLGICLNVLLLATPSPASHRLLVKALPVWQSLAVLSWRHVMATDAAIDDEARPSDMYILLLHIVSVVALVRPTAMAATTQLSACSTWLRDHPPSMACEDAWDLHMLAMRVIK